MSRTVIITSEPAARFSSPPADRIAGRPRRAAAQARAGAPRVSAATEARANSFLDREALLDAAMHQGVIGGGLRDHYAQCYDADPEGTRSYLQSLGLRGSTPGTASASASQEYVDTHLSSAERQRIAAAREGRQHSRIVNGGL